MKNIKIYLQYPWKFPDSPYYKYLLANPPRNAEFINSKQSEHGAIVNKKLFFFSTFLKRSIRNAANKLYLPFLNAHLTKSNSKYEIIHCAHCISKNNSPWVADFESSGQFWVSGNPTDIGKKNVRKIILSKNCKKLMPWTENTKDGILKLFPEVKGKLEVVYPAVPDQKFKKKKNKKPIILYAARYFWIKGGLIALETLSRLKEKYGIEIIFISDAPDSIKKKYPNIDFLDLIPQSKLFEYYKEADIFFYPSFVDTFGFALLEAMSFGLPIVSANTEHTATRKEIIKDGKNGFLINVRGKIDYYHMGKKEKQISEALYKKVESLIKNERLRAKISKNNLNEIRDGKFSIAKRNKKLAKIYQEALK